MQDGPGRREHTDSAGSCDLTDSAGLSGSDQEAVNVRWDDEAKARNGSHAVTDAFASHGTINSLDGERRAEDPELREGQALREQLHQGD